MSVINYILENSPSSNKRQILAKGCQCEGNYSVGICLRYVANALIHCVLVLKHTEGMNSVDKNWGHRNKNIKKQPFGDASASHLSLVLWHV